MRSQLQTRNRKWWMAGMAGLCVLLFVLWKWNAPSRPPLVMPRVGTGDETDGSLGGTVAVEPDDESLPDRLTLDQSRQLIHLGWEEGRAWNAYRRAHPDVCGEMLALLEDENHLELHEEALLVLAYVATDTDIPRLRKWLDKKQGPLSVDDQDAVTVLFDAVGIMARRGNPQATVWLKEMTTVVYWVPPKFSWSAIFNPHAQPAEYETLCRAMFGYAMSHPTDLSERVQKILADVKDRNAGEILAYQIVADRLAKYPDEIEAKEREPIEPYIIEYLNNKATAAVNPGTTVPPDMNQKPALPAVQKPVAVASKPVVLAEGDIPEADRAALVEQATAATSRFLKLAAEEKVEELIPLLMDNDKPLDQRRARESAEFAKDLRREAPICQRLLDRKIVPQFRPGSLSIERTLDADGKVTSEQVRLKLDLPQTAADVKELFPALRGDETFAPNGDLIMTLRRIDNTWYWQPFGW